ncbi:hypothetical protein BDB00DRAFT_795616 [Zychaea mexicana]|uniref:uncharacterized protein n=2 Tax=Zychaea mexicana TaxID=64656 RepID=UPI0022FE9B5F|nr:uncharacterized protein BDB00DRAFT_840287 [Zychaea mexicana]XP_052976416.1 uncharacterized protein BDB00DRAFT_839225 [Zychaea mexicana]XP_052983384.1 uncharacterized protein BDB00DRAFT_806846 [Zychaea mexicana]XP_052983821.1 uncharacterized protein BDB00DRAFT_803091 [Zychaea mexicana]XP_052985408.1 uncharacterized protein BDB00DRAFT_795616 [Zychaea mexicana]KAI9489965.1 hypothetical protein BDB00DRAFT_840287 [Zychaea mexicana]KAI9490151.1 hypothetical protein BDB00DRAFT_839225 [Zychaea mex
MKTAVFARRFCSQPKTTLLCIAIVQAIWSAHWFFIFEGHPFIPQAVAAHATAIYHRTYK